MTDDCRQFPLDESGYHYTLQYEPPTTNRRKNRQRNNIIWYNPPFSKNTSTNIGYKFLALIDKHFPKDHKLGKIFNRNTIKISYSCMNNAKQIIDNHNKQILKSYTQANDTATANPNTIQNKKTCNCRQKNTCPLEGNCLQSSVIYRRYVIVKYVKYSKLVDFLLKYSFNRRSTRTRLRSQGDRLYCQSTECPQSLNDHRLKERAL